jgi:hypothetical protein
LGFSFRKIAKILVHPKAEETMAGVAEGLFKAESDLRAKWKDMHFELPDTVMKEPARTAETQAQLAQSTSRTAVGSAALLSFEGGKVVKDEKFVATDRGITVGSEVVLIEEVELFELGTKLLVDRITCDGVWCTGVGVDTAVQLRAASLQVPLVDKKRKAEDDGTSLKDPVLLDLPVGLPYVLASEFDTAAMIRAWVMSSLCRLALSANPGCDVLHLTENPREMVVARKLKVGELTLVPFSLVLHDTVAPDVVLCPGACETLKVLQKPNVESTFFILAPQPQAHHAGDSTSTRPALCPFWFIKAVVPLKGKKTVFLKRELVKVESTGVTKAVAPLKNSNRSSSCVLVVPTYVNDVELLPGTRLALCP